MEYSINQIEKYINEVQDVRRAVYRVRTLESDFNNHLLALAPLKDEYENENIQLEKSINNIYEFTKNYPEQRRRTTELKKLNKTRKEIVKNALKKKGELKGDYQKILPITREHHEIGNAMFRLLIDINNVELDLTAKEKNKLDKLQSENLYLDFATGFAPLVVALITSISLIRTLKERKKIEEDLKELNESKNSFLSIIGHDLKGPAGAIKLMAELLVKKYDDFETEKKKQMLLRLFNSTVSHLELLEDLLSWAKSQTNKIELNPSALNLLELVNSVLSQVEELMRQKKLVLVNDIPPSHYIYSDENTIRTVIRNLIQNAIKFTHPGGSITINSKQLKDEIELFITDTGVGMDKEKVESLFELGVESSTPGTEGEAGTGLGLILSKEFVEQNHGTITVTSIKEKGSTFIVTLPKARDVK